MSEPDGKMKVHYKPARTYDEVEATKTMVDRTEQRLALKPKRLLADTAYGTGRFLGWLIGRRIVPHVHEVVQCRDWSKRARRRHGPTSRHIHPVVLNSLSISAMSGLVSPAFRNSEKSSRMMADQDFPFRAFPSPRYFK
jgi:hypothetical protein